MPNESPAVPQAQHCWEWQWQEGMCSNICRIWISSCHKAAENRKNETCTDISRQEVGHLCCTGSSCALCHSVANDCNPHRLPARGLPLLRWGHALGSTREPWAPARAWGLMLLEAGAANASPSLLGDSQNAQVTFCGGPRYPGTGARAKGGKPTPQCLQMLFGSRHRSPFLPHFSVFPPTPPDVTEGVTLPPQCYASCFSNPLSHTCIWTDQSYPNATPHLL